jgi:hypothetical protein
MMVLPKGRREFRAAEDATDMNPSHWSDKMDNLEKIVHYKEQ